MPEQGSKGIFANWKARLLRPPTNDRSTPTVSQRRWYIEGIAPESLPVGIESIRLKNLPIGWQQLPTLAKSINALKEEPFGAGFELAQLKPLEKEAIVIPMIASVVANHADPAIPLNLPNSEEVKTIKPWLKRVSVFVGRFSNGLGHRFDRFIEKKGQQTVQKTGEKIFEAAHALGQTENPQSRFVTEVAQLYTRLTQPETYFDFEEKERSIEQKISGLIGQMDRAKRGKPFDSDWFSKKHFPLLANVFAVVGFPPTSLYIESGNVGIVGAELMQGIEIFLRQSDVSNIPQAPLPTEFDLFNMNTWMRGLAELFKAGQLEKVKRELPSVLSQVREVLPHDGRQFEQEIYGIAKNVVALKAKGIEDHALVNGLFAA